MSKSFLVFFKHIIEIRIPIKLIDTPFFKGFIAIVADGSHLNQDIYTALPSGTYCDVISGNYENGGCTGKSVHVDGSGMAHINIQGTTDDPVVALHMGNVCFSD